VLFIQELNNKSNTIIKIITLFCCIVKNKIKIFYPEEIKKNNFNEDF